MRSIYMDNNATTEIDPRVLDSMMPFLGGEYGNAASSSHGFGWRARAATDEAREKVARGINAARASDIVFTSGATESINLAIRGFSAPHGCNHVVTSRIEHKAVLDACSSLERTGFEITYIDVDRFGIVGADAVRAAIRDGTALVSIMAANNEIGTLQDIHAIGSICRKAGVAFHVDATQAVGKTPFDVRLMNIDIASFSAHKVYGPKGVGALYLDSERLGGKIDPQIVGGGHEWGLRSGTLNVAGIVGFGRAVEIACELGMAEARRIAALRDMLQRLILEKIPGVTVNGRVELSLPGVLNVSFEGVDADSLLLEMPEVALSSGSACTSANPMPSHVLKAIGLSDELATASVRFGLGRFNTPEEVEYVACQLSAAVARLRAMAPRSLWAQKA